MVKLINFNNYIAKFHHHHNALILTQMNLMMISFTQHNAEISTTMYDIIIRNNGLNGFYKGFYFPLITNGTVNALVFALYGNVMR